MAEARLTAVVETKGAKRANDELNKISKTSKKVEGNVIKAEKRFKSFGKNSAAAIAAIDGPLGGISSRISSLTTLATAGGLSMTALAVGITGVTVALVMGVFELDKLNIGLAKSEALIKATGGAAGFTATQLQEQAQALALLTLANTEGIQKAQGILQTFDRVQGDVFTRAITLGQDLAAVYGGDVATQATQLGKALQDPIKGITALNRVGVTFTDTQREQINLFVKGGEVAKAQEVILANLTSQVGGAGGSVAAGSLAGALDTTGQLYSEWVANLADSTGTYSSVISLVNTLNSGLLVSAQLADKNSKRNFQNLVAQRVALTEEIKAIKSDTQDSLFSFLGGNAQVELLAAQMQLKEIDVEITRIRTANTTKAKEELTALDAGNKVKEIKRKEDLVAQGKIEDAKVAKLKISEDKKLATQKASAQKELNTILSLNNSELQAVDAKEAARLDKVKGFQTAELISFQEFVNAKKEIELAADAEREALTLKRAEESKTRFEEENALAIKLGESFSSNLAGGLIDAAAAGDSFGDVVEGAVLDVSKSILQAGLEQLIQQQLVDKIIGASYATSVASQVTATSILASQAAFASTAATPIVGPALAPAAAVAAGSAASAIGAPAIAAAAAREQGGSLSAGQSSTVAERGQLEILTPSSSSRVRTAQQMKSIMGESNSQRPLFNQVIIDQTSGGVQFENSADDEGRIIQIVRDTVTADSQNPNSEIMKGFANATNLQAIR